MRKHGRRRQNAADRILHAAAERLAVIGAADLSMQDVATAAGVSKALIHYHYKDKESLLEQIAAWATAGSLEREQRALDDCTAAGAVDALWRWLDAELRGGHLRLLLELGQYRAPRVRAAVADSFRVRCDASMQTIRRLFELLELRPRVPVDLLAGVVVAFIDGLASRAPAEDARDARVTFDVFWLSVLSLAE
jgi:AcrR family transcriptional regulator